MDPRSVGIERDGTNRIETQVRPNTLIVSIESCELDKNFRPLHACGIVKRVSGAHVGELSVPKRTS